MSVLSAHPGMLFLHALSSRGAWAFSRARVGTLHTGPLGGDSAVQPGPGTKLSFLGGNGRKGKQQH